MNDFNAQAVLILIALGVVIAVVAAVYTFLGIRVRRRLAEASLRWGVVPDSALTIIQPPRVADATAHVRIEPDPMDYRKAIRIVHGLSDNPLDAVEAPALPSREVRHEVRQWPRSNNGRRA